jgi:hypothetical protein
MTQSPTIRKTGSRPMSAAAQADIDERREAARPNYLAELALLLRARQGRATVPQMISLAAVLAAIPNRSDDLATTLRRWIGEAGGRPPPESDALAARGADTAEPGRRELVRIWDITAAEEEALDLRALVGEGRRSRQRRRAEGARPADEAQGARAAARSEPWVAAGLSRATYYRRLRNAPVQAAVEEVREALGTSDSDPEPWLTAGVSRATYYRRLRETRETENETRADPIPKKRKKGISGVDPNLNPRLTPTTRSRLPAELTRTAEARRLVALAERLGLPFSDWAQHESPRTWYDLDVVERLPAGEQDTYHSAVGAAAAALERRQALDTSRARVQVPDARIAPPAAAPCRYACPARVSPAVWSEVPAPLRPRVLKLAGREFLRGAQPDAAVVEAVKEVQRERTLARAVHTAAAAVGEPLSLRQAVLLARHAGGAGNADEIVARVRQEKVEAARKVREQAEALRAVTQALTDLEARLGRTVSERSRPDILSRAAEALAQNPEAGAVYLVRKAAGMYL